MSNGIVFLVGAGPGDPGLIAVKGLEALRQADVVVYDALANPRLLREARADAELISAGKRGGCHTMKQDEINALLVAKGKEGKRVCRLKGGDPFVFGRGGEEALALAEAGVPFEVVPGVTAGIAAPAYAGIPVTHRGLAASVAFVTGHEDPTKEASDIAWDKLATGVGTLVFYMGVKNLAQIVERLTARGLAAETPAAVVQWGTSPRQRTAVGTLSDIEERSAGIEAPAVLVVGKVAALREQLRWFDLRPLFGRRIVVTRARAQASELCQQLEALGAEVIEMPTIRIEPPADWAPLDRAIAELTRATVEGGPCGRGLRAPRGAETPRPQSPPSPGFQWVLFTSVNGVDGFFGRLALAGKDARALPRVAAIGPATAERLASHGIRPDCQPERFTGAELVQALAAQESIAGQRVLLPRAADVPETVRKGLEEAGAVVTEVDAYRTIVGGEADEEAVEQVAAGGVDFVTFTSSSTVRGFVQALGPARAAALPSSVRLVSIGPVTSETARELGLAIAAEAEKHTIPGLVATLRDLCTVQLP
ncbi:MAG: uroporphyrinogen-III C-methyltransferase [Planctomycetes bacterium]|nr:uroporphyrinogen-III C-methyltransferase [Planctomycetota bacterium]